MDTEARSSGGFAGHVGALVEERLDQSRVASTDAAEPLDLFGCPVGPLRRRLFQRAMCLTRDHDLAEDLVQETLWRAWQARHTLRLDTSILAWMTCVLKNLFIDGRRKDALTIRETIERPVEREEVEPTLLDVMSADDVWRAVRTLAFADRQLVEFVYRDRLSYGCIARRLGIRLNTVGTRLFRAKRKVRSILLAERREQLPEGSFRD